MAVSRIDMSPIFLLVVAACWLATAQAIMVPTGKVGPIVPATPRPRRTVPTATSAPAPVYELADDPSANEVDGPRFQPPVYRPPLLKHLLLRSHSLKFRQLYAHELPSYFQKQIIGDSLPKYDRGTTRVKHSDQVVPLAYYRRKMYYSGYPNYDY